MTEETPYVAAVQVFTGAAPDALLVRKMFKRGEILRLLRESATEPMTQKDLAERAGVSLGTVQRAEQGSSKVTADMWAKLCAVVGMDPLEMDARAEALTEAFSARGVVALREAKAGAVSDVMGRRADASSAASNSAGRLQTVTDDEYLKLLQRWWGDLEETDHERIAEFARVVRLERQALRKASASPND